MQDILFLALALGFFVIAFVASGHRDAVRHYNHYSRLLRGRDLISQARPVPAALER